MRARVLIILAFAGSLCAAPLVAGQAPGADQAALPRMVATERAFAAATAHLGVRDGFLTFFADDAVRVVPGENGGPVRVEPARAALAARPLVTLPLATRLVWEPFTGHVSADGSFGWLTGGYATMAETTPAQLLSQGAYFSVWKRQPDGTWRVWLDEGVGFPSVWQDASPFRVAAEPDPGESGRGGEPLEEAEAGLAAGGEAWRARLAADVRLHRDGVMPITGRARVADWAAGAWSSVRFSVVTTERAPSNDLGVAIGGYEAAARAGAERGIWIRVWKRDVTGRWRIVFETSRAA